MVDSDYPVLYYRTAAPAAQAAGDDYRAPSAAPPSGPRGTAADIDALAPARKLVFSGQNHYPHRGRSGATLQPAECLYTPNLVRKPVPLTNSTTVKVQQAGKQDEAYDVFAWNVRASSADALRKSWTWPALPQTAADYPHGVFGLWYPALPLFSIDPSATRGLSMLSHRTRPQPKDGSVDFEVPLLLGGETPRVP